MTEAAQSTAPPERDPAGRLALWLAPLLVLAVAARAIGPYPVGILWDDAVYVELGKALATGAGLHYLHLPGMPADTHFPPGYPALLAVLWHLVPTFPANVLLFKAMNAVLVAVAAVWIAAFARTRFRCSRAQSAAVAVVLSVGVPTLVISALVMSEPFFLALALPALYLAERVVDEKRSLVGPVGAGILAGAATLVRSHGVALVAGLVLVLAMRRRFRDAVAAGAAALVVLAPWQWWVHVHTGALPPALRGTYGPYTVWFADAVRAGGASFVLKTMAGTAHGLVGLFLTWLSPVASVGVGIAALVLILPFVALGVREMWKAAPVTVAFLAFYFVIVLVWPYAPTRFVFAVWPLLGALPLLGARAVWRNRAIAGRTLPAVVRIGLLIVLAVPAAGYVRLNVRGYRGHWWHSIARQRGPDLRSVVREVRSATPANALLCGTDDAAIYLYTGRQAVPIASFQATDFTRPASVDHEADVLLSILHVYHPDAVVVTTQGQRDVVDTLAARWPHLLAVADSFPGGFIYSSTAK